jgi:uncharacterized phage infection (PIP) family protein YhgE
MTEGRGWGSTVLGWFIVREDATAGEAAPAPEAPGAAATNAGPMPNVFSSEPPAATGGKVDFNGVFDAAGIAKEDRDRIGKADELLQSLPADTPVAVRKQIVEASLKAFGVPIDRIIETGVEEIQALEGYIRSGATDTQKVLEESNRRIQQFEDEIKNIRTVMEQRVQEQQAVTTACNARKLDVQRILEFFGQEAVARVVRESPKLHDPSAGQGS